MKSFRVRADFQRFNSSIVQIELWKVVERASHQNQTIYFNLADIFYIQNIWDIIYRALSAVRVWPSATSSQIQKLAIVIIRADGGGRWPPSSNNNHRHRQFGRLFPQEKLHTKRPVLTVNYVPRRKAFRNREDVIFPLCTIAFSFSLFFVSTIFVCMSKILSECWLSAIAYVT